MLKARGKLNVVLLSWERNVGPHYQSKNCDEKRVVAVVPGLAGLAMLLTALLMQGLKGIKTAHVFCVCLISVEYVDKQRTFQTGYALHIFKNETSHFRQHFALKVYWTCNSFKYLLL